MCIKKQEDGFFIQNQKKWKKRRVIKKYIILDEKTEMQSIFYIKSRVKVPIIGYNKQTYYLIKS